MKKSIVCEKLRKGQPVMVAKHNFFNPELAELIGYTGWDALWLCNEHEMIDRSLLASILRGAKISGIDMMVRLSASDYTDLIQPLEAGAQGLMIPHVHTAEQLRWIVRETKFHPIGFRGMDCVNQDADQGMAKTLDYIKFANENTFIVAQIEDDDALQKVDELAAVKGIDVIFLGPADYSHSIGLPGQVRHPKVIDAIRRCADACAKHGITCGTVGFNDIEFCRQLIGWGVKFITGPSDYRIVSQGFAAMAKMYEDSGLFTLRHYPDHNNY